MLTTIQASYDAFSTKYRRRSLFDLYSHYLRGCNTQFSVYLLVHNYYNNLACFHFEGNPINFTLYSFSIDKNIIVCAIIIGGLITVYLSRTKFPIVLGDKGPYISLPMSTPRPVKGSSTDALPVSEGSSLRPQVIFYSRQYNRKFLKDEFAESRRDQ